MGKEQRENELKKQFEDAARLKRSGLLKPFQDVIQPEYATRFGSEAIAQQNNANSEEV